MMFGVIFFGVQMPVPSIKNLQILPEQSAIYTEHPLNNSQTTPKALPNQYLNSDP